MDIVEYMRGVTAKGCPKCGSEIEVYMVQKGEIIANCTSDECRHSHKDIVIQIPLNLDEM